MQIKCTIKPESPNVFMEINEQGFEGGQIGEVEVQDLHVPSTGPCLAHLLQCAEPFAFIPFGLTLTQAALAFASDQNDNHIFISKYHLFKSGHWPLIVKDNVFNIF